MKTLKFYFALTLSIAFVISCSKKESKNAEVRFVDLQGNPKPIKTRVPEANAKIMSGQSISYNDSPLQNEFKNNQKNIASNTVSNDKNLPTGNSFADNNPRYLSSINSPSSANEKISTDDKYQPQNPVVEYDLTPNEKSSKSDIYGKESDFVIDDKSIKKNIVINEDQDDLVEVDLNNQQSLINKKNILIKTPNKNSKNTINYSAKNIKKSKKPANQVLFESPQNEESTNNSGQDEVSLDSQENTSMTIINQSSSSRGKFYVQVGAFHNSKSAKERLLLIKNQGKGKIMIGNLNGKKIYRSVFGPYNSKSKANIIKDKIINSGNDAIIYKN
jgi:cell division septation protein DedD